MERSVAYPISLLVMRGYYRIEALPDASFSKLGGEGVGFDIAVLATSQKQRVVWLAMALSRSRDLGQKCVRTLDFSPAFQVSLSVVDSVSKISCR